MKFNTSFIRACYMGAVFTGVERVYGITTEELNIPQALMDEPMALIPFGQICIWLERLEQVTQDPAYMLKLAQHLDFSRLNVPGISFLATTDLAMSVRRINYGIASFQSGASYYIIQSGKIIKWCYRNPYAFNQHKTHDSLRVVIMLFNTLKHFLGDEYRPLQVHISGPKVGKQDAESLFNCPVIWNAPQTEIWIDTDALVQQSSVPLEESSTISMPRTVFEQYLDMPQPHDTPKVLFEMVNYARFYGLPTVDKVAALFNISRQQLQRRLLLHGFNFTSIRGYILSNQGIKYMLDGRSIEEITLLLGYANKQSFSKAFKRFRNCTPQEYLARIKP
ncbi:AraC family transcriptional regulator [Shewanella violacea]|uniref:AraC-type DNA-binding domain-containing protein n=1 Tax=Shewanella violacea (strain JCM 10179 / CIP 106290 / LMG 19151 / DSS12) TaxID=637905 RepID=D4ZED8_SHEVD|nr:AraC family transcriptional regulator [Shewanella violacea]BAJ00168.1 AraC-type DNA-binding domain-containing protein [Shewanella violacea DSS12]